MPRTKPATEAQDDLTRIAIIEVQYSAIQQQLKEIADNLIRSQEHTATQLDDIKKQLNAIPEKYVSRSDGDKLEGQLRKVQDKLTRYPLEDLDKSVNANTTTINEARSQLKLIGTLWAIFTFVAPFIANWLWQMWQAGR